MSSYSVVLTKELFKKFPIPCEVSKFVRTRRATQSLLKIRKSFDRFLKQWSKAFEERRRRAGGGAEGLVSPGGG